MTGPEDLLEYLNPDGGLPYVTGTRSFSEPTLLMILALLAGKKPAKAQPLVNWILQTRNPDGSMGLNPEFRQEGLWNTALLAIAMHRLEMTPQRDAAVDFLLKFRSIPVARAPENDLDTSLIGWPWVAGTFGWVEPTAWAIMALNLANKREHPRAVEGRRLLHDRCLEKGGWNYGNKAVFGHTLMPFWDSTALALLALDRSDGVSFEKSLNLLERSLSDICSLYSMSLTCLCLRRFGRNVTAIQEQVGNLLASHGKEGLNLAHGALGFIALSPEGVFTP